jgi:hypothetical protein
MMGAGTSYVTVIGYRPSPYCGEGWLEQVVREDDGTIRGNGQLPDEGTITGLLNQPADPPSPIGTRVQT